MDCKKGFVSFVGAGPGDIGLITQKGIQCIKKADVILYDRLANPRLLRYAKDDCAFQYCGKLPKRHTLRQEKINEMLVHYAREGKYVVRLKGGDPSVFGRVGEEAEELVKHDILYEIVPGITSSVAAAAYAGIPVTHREHSNSFTIRTGHVCIQNENAACMEQEIGDTVAYYMGVKSLPANCKKLVEQGRDKNTSVAVIEWGTLGKQRAVEGTLETIAGMIEKENIQNPAMMIVGDVVSLRESIAWFEKKKFKGRKLIIAKTTKDEFQLENYFTHQGAEVYSFPVMKKLSFKLTADEINTIQTSNQLMFNDPESVDYIMDELMAAGYDSRDLPRKIEYSCEKTRKALAAKGVIGYQISGNKQAIFIGPKNKEDVEQDKAIFTHQWIVDARFREVNERMLKEDEWETVIFPNKKAVNTYLEELEELNIQHLQRIRFAYIGKSVKEFALQQGFLTIDEEIQDELNRQEWRDF
jgi:uroporphyrinogen III methyltransferase / synthase